MNEQENKKSDEHFLLKEIHHRVKNNLNTIIGLLELQSQQIEDVLIKEMFRESINRIRSMAIIHEYFFRSESQSEIDLAVYIESLVDNLLLNYSDKKRELTVNYRMESILIDFDLAIPVGLIVNEIVTNSIKHGFMERSKGKIDILLAKKESKINLTIKDNGVGIPVNLDIENVKSLGLQLVKLLAAQLNADYRIFREDGTTVQIEIPLNSIKLK